jgi:hypothetical protein
MDVHSASAKIHLCLLLLGCLVLIDDPYVVRGHMWGEPFRPLSLLQLISMPTSITVKLTYGRQSNHNSRKRAPKPRLYRHLLNYNLVNFGSAYVSRFDSFDSIQRSFIRGPSESTYTPSTMSAAFSATAYNVAWRCAAGINGMVLASTTLSFSIPYTFRFALTQPLSSSGISAHQPLECA